MKTELLYGIHPVYEALAAGRRKVYEIYLDKEKKSERIAQIESMAESIGVLIKKVGSDDLKALAGTVGHQGSAAMVSPYRQVTVSDILQTVPGGDEKRFLLMLDNIQDPQNLGTVIRTALCVGIAWRHCTQRPQCPADPCGFQSFCRGAGAYPPGPGNQSGTNH